MLQQTTVQAAGPYYARFLARFPSIEALAAADESAVLRAWAGLGYYARARNLHACARRVATSGGFPRTLDGLRALPGIGAYTARAIGAIAFGVPVLAVDGNVERVLCRLGAITTPLPAAKKNVAALAARLEATRAVEARPGDAVQAMFDLGASICGKGEPACVLCPWQRHCAARAAGMAGQLPARAAKPARPIRHGVAFRLTDSTGRVLLRKRPAKGLLGGMDELPGTPWRDSAWNEAEAMTFAPHPAGWRDVGEVRHVFTHFELRLTVYAAEGDAGADMRHPDQAALPSVMRKCLEGGGRRKERLF